MKQTATKNVYSTITARQLAAKLEVSLRHIRRMDSSGKLPKPVRFGKSVRWLVDEINSWLEAGAPDRKRWEAIKEARKWNR